MNFVDICSFSPYNDNKDILEGKYVMKKFLFSIISSMSVLILVVSLVSF